MQLSRVPGPLGGLPPPTSATATATEAVRQQMQKLNTSMRECWHNNSHWVWPVCIVLCAATAITALVLAIITFIKFHRAEQMVLAILPADDRNDR